MNYFPIFLSADSVCFIRDLFLASSHHAIMGNVNDNKIADNTQQQVSIPSRTK